MIRYELVTSKDDALKYKSQIQELAKISYGKDYFTDELFDWFNIKCIGNPVISLCFDNNKLIGHSMAFPQDCLIDCHPIYSYASANVMVHPEYRKLGLFTKQTLIIEEYLKSKNINLIISFPNSNSLPVFEKKLNRDAFLYNYLVDIDYNDLDTLIHYIEEVKDNRSILEINFNIFLWRMSKPNCEYIIRDGIILKKYNDKYTILDIKDYFKDTTHSFKKDEKYNIFIDGRYIEKYFKNHMKTPYTFCYKFLNDINIPKHCKEINTVSLLLANPF